MSNNHAKSLKWAWFGSDLYNLIHQGLVKNRITFNEKYSKYVNNLDEKSDEGKVKGTIKCKPSMCTRVYIKSH